MAFDIISRRTGLERKREYYRQLEIFMVHKTLKSARTILRSDDSLNVTRAARFQGKRGTIISAKQIATLSIYACRDILPRREQSSANVDCAKNENRANEMTPFKRAVININLKIVKLSPRFISIHPRE